MSNREECKGLLTRYLRARIPFIAIETIEKPRALELLKEISDELGLIFWAHDLSKGTFELNADKNLSDDLSFYGAIDYLSNQMKRGRNNLTLILTSPPNLSSESDDAQQLLATCTLANDYGGSIIVFTNSAVWNQLQRLGMIVKLDFPDEEETFTIIKKTIDDYRNQISIEWDEIDIRDAASTLAGVSKIETDNIIAALAARGSIKKSDLEEVHNAKDRLFSDISGLEKINVTSSASEVGGLSGLRKWLDEKKELLNPEKRNTLKEKGLRPPRGILLVGVPGCGKSLSAKAISANWKLPLYRLDFATVQGSYVGQSEQQLRDALKTAESVSPCILWIDEIEKGLSGANSSNDGGVSTRMVGQFLFWLQECSKLVFVVATANDVSKLPSELLRRGRFDELFFIDLPAPDERREILTLYMKKYLNLDFSGDFSDKIVNMTDGFTGADLESSVRDLAYRNIANDNFILSKENIEDTFNNVIPLSRTSPEKIEDIRDWGKSRAVPASGRPIGSDEIKKDNGSKVRRVLV